jgi:hypothetical protein
MQVQEEITTATDGYHESEPIGTMGDEKMKPLLKQFRTI